MLSNSSNATTNWVVFKILKKSADKAMEVFLIMVRRHFLLATRKKTASRDHLNMEMFHQAVEGLTNTAVQRTAVEYMDVDQSPQWEDLRNNNH